MQKHQSLSSSSQRCHVLHIVEPFGAGVIESVSRIVHALPPNQFKITILHGFRPETPQDYRSRLPGHTETIQWNASREINPVKDTQALWSLLRHMKMLKPDIVHAHSAKAGILARIACRILGYRCIYSPRAYSFLRQDVSASKRFTYKAIERAAAKLGAMTVAASESEYAIAKTLGGKSQLIRNMIDINGVRAIVAHLDAPRKQDHSAHEPFTVGTSGRLSAQKNVALFLKVALLCPNFRFIWIGGTIDELGFLECPPNVCFTGWLPRDQVLTTVKGFDILLQSSLWEGLPISVLEAMALEKPIVAYPAVGNIDLVEQDGNGFLCVSPEAFAAKLHILAADRTLRETMGRRSLEILQRDYDVAVNATYWRNLYLSTKS